MATSTTTHQSNTIQNLLEQAQQQLQSNNIKNPLEPPPPQQQRATFDAGNFSWRSKSSDGRLLLSNGLQAYPVAQAGQYVALVNGFSRQRFHQYPDGAAIFSTPTGGWTYVSNSEHSYTGGVGAIDFDANGNVVNYRRLIGPGETKLNCGGGATPWKSWVTCEEADGGRVYQVDPSGRIGFRTTALGDLGMYESFTYDDSTFLPTFYVTRDDWDGVISRFTPNAIGMQCYRQVRDLDRWCTLEHGTVDYLYLYEDGRATWTSNYRVASQNAASLYPNSEGIDIKDGVLYFVSKVWQRLIIVDLRTQMYQFDSTRSGAFQEQPDQVARIAGDDILYFCEDGGSTPGVHGRNRFGQFFTILEGVTFQRSEETTGLAFSPDAKHMYVSFQDRGIVYDVTRQDGLRFDGAMVDIKYHRV